jgi:hypothetical protein
MKTARYLISAPAFVRLHPDDPESIHLGGHCDRNNPAVIEIPANDVPPSRTWKPLNAAAKAALAEIGVDAEIVKEPAPAQAGCREVDTMLSATMARSKVVGRPSDIDPLTGEPAAPAPPRLASTKKA